MTGRFPLTLVAAAALTALHTVRIAYQGLTGSQSPSSSARVSHAGGIHLRAMAAKADFAIKRMAEEGSPEIGG